MIICWKTVLENRGMYEYVYIVYMMMMIPRGKRSSSHPVHVKYI